MTNWRILGSTAESSHPAVYQKQTNGYENTETVWLQTKSATRAILPNNFSTIHTHKIFFLLSILRCAQSSLVPFTLRFFSRAPRHTYSSSYFCLPIISLHFALVSFCLQKHTTKHTHWLQLLYWVHKRENWKVSRSFGRSPPFAMHFYCSSKV